MTAGWNLLFTTGLYNHLAMHLFAESKVHPEIGNMCCQYVPEGRMNLSCCLDSSIPVGTMSTALRNTCFSVTLATLARYSTLNTFYTLPWLRSTGRKDLIRNMCFFFPLIILPSFPGMMEIRDVTEEEQRTQFRLSNLSSLFARVQLQFNLVKIIQDGKSVKKKKIENVFKRFVSSCDFKGITFNSSFLQEKNLFLSHPFFFFFFNIQLVIDINSLSQIYS